jgi:D-alanyl-D-alanine carboxypeptidase
MTAAGATRLASRTVAKNGAGRFRLRWDKLVGWRIAHMTRGRSVLLWLAFAASLAWPVSAQAPDTVIRGRVRALFEALSGGSAERFEAMAQEAFAPEMLARRSPQERRELFERIREDFGAMTLGDVRAVNGETVELTVKGASGLLGSIELAFEAVAPYRIASMAMRVEAGGSEPRSPRPPAVSGAMAPADLARGIDEHVAQLAASDAFAGVVLVARDGVAIFEKAYGLADREKQLPVTTTTRFSLGSINKIFTKTAIGQLVAQGRLALTDTIGRWLPDYPNERARAATIDQLLTHRAGIADFFGPEFAAAPKAQFRSNADYYRFVARQPLLFEPGTKRQYCNGCYVVLGAIIERVTGTRYEDYIATHVFDKAGMEDAGFFASDRLPAGVARGYTRRSAQGEGVLKDNVDMHGVAGSAAGGAYATAADLLAFDSALREHRLLDAKGTAWLLDTDVPASGRAGGELGIAGGAPGVNAILESNGTWTTIVLANLDPPAAGQLGTSIQRQLTR